ncbi:MAG TPA: hypothetical protein VEU62_21590, partial [Bryobacterales bacterium]|nr:hypothetical protein [Bryobacterales bacterium]
MEVNGPAANPAPFVCPRCKGRLEYTADSYYCDRCRLRFPVLCGIPDFRLAPDRYISIDDDRRKGRRLFEEAARRSFAEMLDYYYSITPEVPPDLARKFTAHALAEVEIGEAALAELPGDLPRGGGPEGSRSTGQPGSLPPRDPQDIGRSGSLLDAAGSTARASALSSRLPPGGLLDAGCSTGGLVVAAARRFAFVAGVDVAFRWLVVGAVRLREASV